MTLAIEATGVSKTFALAAQGATSLKERLLRRGHAPGRFEALADVSVSIPVGHTVGLIGANGSGKSTLLKVLAGIIRPTSGTVVATGRIASLLELGAGFNGELSGRDNVYLNASLLGLSRRDTDELFDSIVDFSELADFIDSPVKHYSSGMYVRLGFAVAVHVDPDILLIDEVLAVGDEAFARKCLERIAAFQAEGRTILFVSHDLDLVERMCDRGVVLHHGHVMFDGDPAYAAGTLRGILGTGAAPIAAASDPQLYFDEPRVSATPGGEPVPELRGGDPLVIEVAAHVAASYVDRVDHLQVVVMGAGDIPVVVMRAERAALPRTPGTWRVRFVTVAPRIHGGFRIASQLADADDVPLAAGQGSEVFWVRSGHAVGLVGVDFTVGSMVEAVGS